jgi:hypothetical protein
MQQVIRRSVSRGVTQRELWNGNREDPREWIKADHPIRWSWSTHARKRVEYEARYREPQHAHLDVHRFRTPRETRAWLETL